MWKRNHGIMNLRLEIAIHFFFFLIIRTCLVQNELYIGMFFYCFDFSHAKVIQSPGRLLLYQRITIILWFTFHGCQVCLWCKSLCYVAILFLLFFICCNFLAGEFTRQLRFLMVVLLFAIFLTENTCVKL